MIFGELVELSRREGYWLLVHPDGTGRGRNAEWAYLATPGALSH